MNNNGITLTLSMLSQFDVKILFDLFLK